MNANDDQPSTHLSWTAITQRLVIGAAGALIFGAGAMIFNSNTAVKIHEERIQRLEGQMGKLSDIDKNVVALSGKVDVINQKLDDAREVAARKPR
jgi:hypothetical protein